MAREIDTSADAVERSISALRHPDLRVLNANADEAADRLKALAAENAKLRRFLQISRDEGVQALAERDAARAEAEAVVSELVARYGTERAALQAARDAALAEAARLRDALEAIRTLAGVCEWARGTRPRSADLRKIIDAALAQKEAGQ